MPSEQQLSEEQFDAVLQRVIASAPQGLSEADFNTLLQREVAKAEAGAQPLVSVGGGRGTRLDVRKSNRIASENAPAIGGALGALATTPVTGPLGPIAAVMAAGAGGTGGALARGDAPRDALKEGATQAAMEAGGRVAMPLIRMAARGTMKGAIPRHILQDFDDVDVAQQALNRGAVMGSERSAARISKLSDAANQTRDRLAATVPDMPATRVVDDMRPMYDKALLARMPDDAHHIAEHGRAAVREIGGPTAALSGPSQLARKDLLQSKGRAALNAANPRNAALDPQLYNAERKTILAHLRQTPGMEKALDESQALMALDKAGKDTANSSFINRARQSTASALLSPMGLSTTAHALNQGARLADPNVARLLLSLLSQRSNEQ